MHEALAALEAQGIHLDALRLRAFPFPDSVADFLAQHARVFVVEQNCPYLETDGQDLVGDTCHLLARDESGLVGYLRLLDPQHMEGEVVNGRVLTAGRARGTGLGHQQVHGA